MTEEKKAATKAAKATQNGGGFRLGDGGVFKPASELENEIQEFEVEGLMVGILPTNTPRAMRIINAQIRRIGGKKAEQNPEAMPLDKRLKANWAGVARACFVTCRHPDGRAIEFAEDDPFNDTPEDRERLLEMFPRFSSRIEDLIRDVTEGDVEMEQSAAKN